VGQQKNKNRSDKEMDLFWCWSLVHLPTAVSGILFVVLVISFHRDPPEGRRRRYNKKSDFEMKPDRIVMKTKE
jgi:hypothetical protein